jgi:transmembrane sensor
MTRPSSSNDADDPSAAALNWLIALQEEPDSAALKARFDAWLAESPRHREAWGEARKVWSLVGSTTPVHVDAPAAAAATAVRMPGRRRLIPVLGAAALALAASLMIVVLPGLTMRLSADVVTATGETRRMTLADGSTLHLGAGSAVNIAYSDRARRVRLLAGTVFVEVTPDPGRPFGVVANGLESTALGTAYEVRSVEGGTAVAVAHGTVSAEYPPTALSMRLGAGEWVRVDRDGAVIARGASSTERVAAWRDGRLAVSDWAVSDVVGALGPYFHGAILVLDEALFARRVTGVYDLSDPVGALRAAVYPHGAAVRRITPWLLVVSAR